jgi:hypothetical protein
MYTVGLKLGRGKKKCIGNFYKPAESGYLGDKERDGNMKLK